MCRFHIFWGCKGTSESCNIFVFVFFFLLYLLCFILCLLFSIETNKNILKHFLFDCGNEKATALIASLSPADQYKYAQHLSIVPELPISNSVPRSFLPLSHQQPYDDMIMFRDDRFNLSRNMCRVGGELKH